jgi:hypothetical protein
MGGLGWPAAKVGQVYDTVNPAVAAGRF